MSGKQGPEEATPTHEGERMTEARLSWLEGRRDCGEVPDDADVLDWLTECIAALRAERDGAQS